MPRSRGTLPSTSLPAHNRPSAVPAPVDSRPPARYTAEKLQEGRSAVGMVLGRASLCPHPVRFGLKTVAVPGAERRNARQTGFCAEQRGNPGKDLLDEH